MKATLNRIVSAGVIAGLLATVPANAGEPGFAVSVGVLVVNSASGWDVFSAADFKVRIRRHDPAVAAAITDLDTRVLLLEEQAGQFLTDMQPLRQKEDESKITPGPPLTDSEREAHDRLSAMRYSEMTAAQIGDLNQLMAKKEASELRPGPPLTAEEEGRLQTLDARRADGLAELESVRSERSRTLRLVYGHTRTLTSESRTLQFDSGPVLTVCEDDALLITVVDEDVSNDDLMGRYALAVTSQLLEEGSVDLGHAGSVRSLLLHFTPLPDEHACGGPMPPGQPGPRGDEPAAPYPPMQ